MTDEQRQIEIQIMNLMKRMLGYQPIGMVDLLHILIKPEVLPLTKQYIASVEASD